MPYFLAKMPISIVFMVLMTSNLSTDLAATWNTVSLPTSSTEALNIYSLFRQSRLVSLAIRQLLWHGGVVSIVDMLILALVVGGTVSIGYFSWLAID